MSQNSQGSSSNIEFIDLTDETLTNINTTVLKNDKFDCNHTKITHDQTITIDDSFVPLEDESDDNGDNDSSNDSLPSRITLSSKSPISESSDNPEIISQSQPISEICNNNHEVNPLDEFLNYSSPSQSPDPNKSSSNNTTPVKESGQIPPSMKKKKLKTSSTPKLLTKSAIQLQRRIEKEEAKKNKLKQKEEEKLEKEANRANAANKALNNCIANVHDNILKLINDPEEITIKTLFDESMIIYRLDDNPRIENSITWTYKRTEVINGNCVVKYIDSKWIMVIVAGSDYLKKLLTYKRDPNDPNSLKKFLIKLKADSQCDIVLVIFNLANHLKTERAKEAKSYRKTFKDKFEGRAVSSDATTTETSTATEASTIGATELQDLRLVLEMELKHEFKSLKLHLEFYEKTSDIIQAMVRYTSSLAKLQVKQKIRSSTGLDWAINMDKERAVDPTKSSEDLTKLWITQLQQFSQVTLPIAKAIAAEYPSPCALLDQYRNLTEKESEDLLGQLYVQRNLKRQIGTNISRRIHCFMTCTDPDTHIGLS